MSEYLDSIDLAIESRRHNPEHVKQVLHPNSFCMLYMIVHII
jgi:hypothetical protein